MALLEKPDRERGFKKERIIRVLLNHQEKDLTKYRVAQLADVSQPWTQQYTNQLEEDGGLIKDTAVVKPRKLYERWREIRIQGNRLEVSLQQPEQFLEDTDLRYALTTFRAENLHQGLLFVSSTDFYISPGEIEDWLNIVENQGVLGGGNTRIKVSDSHVFYNTQDIQNRVTVSVPQLIVDLMDEGGPCTEAAEKLIDRHHSQEVR